MNKMLDIEILNEELFKEIEKEESADIDVIKELIKNWANINCIGEDGYTPLTYAIEKQITEIVNLLLYILVDSLNEDKINGKPKNEIVKELEEKVDGKQEITM